MTATVTATAVADLAGMSHRPHRVDICIHDKQTDRDVHCTFLLRLFDALIADID